MTLKLTKPQRKLLETIADGEWHTISLHYQPCQYLVANRLANGGRFKYGAFKIRITDKGREALK